MLESLNPFLNGHFELDVLSHFLFNVSATEALSYWKGPIQEVQPMITAALYRLGLGLKPDGGVDGLLTFG